MGIFYIFKAACLPRRWVGLHSSRMVTTTVKKKRHRVNVHVLTVYTHSVNVFGHKDSENEKTPLRHKAKPFPPTQSSTTVISAVVMSEMCR